VVVGNQAKQRLIGILIDDRERISLARVQWVAWFLVLFSSYFVGAVWNAAYGADLPAMEANLFALIGITSGSAVISNLVVDAKKREPKPASATDDSTLVGRIDVNQSSKEAAWEDLYLGEEHANRAAIDVSRLQKLVMTILLVVVYFEMLRSAFAQSSLTYESFSMPAVGTNFVTLLGASHAAYLAYKATPKTAKAAPNPA